MNLNSQKLGVAVAALVIGLSLFIAVLHLKIDQSYSDFVVGSLAWSSEGKYQDLLAWPVFIVSYILSFNILSKITSKLGVIHGAEVSENFTKQLVLWCLPFYAGVAPAILGEKIDYLAIILSAAGVFSLGVLGFFKRKITQPTDPDVWGLALFLAFLLSLAPIELAILLSRMPMGLVGEIEVKTYFDISKFLVLIGFVFGVCALIKKERIIGHHVSKLILTAQIGLPLFYLTLYPSRILQPSGGVVKYETTVYLKILIIILVVYGIYDVIKRYRASFDNENWYKCISPFAVFALIVALKVGVTEIPHISSDDYHFGEYLIGWWSYLKGYVPYVDYIPPHGLIENDFRSFLSHFFYDGTAASIEEAGRLAFTLLGFIAYLSIYNFTGSIVLSFSAILLLGGRISWLFFVPFICLWLNTNLRAKPGKWLCVWIVTLPIVILGVPPQGLLLVAAFGILAVKMGWDQIQFGNRRSWTNLGAVTALMIVLFSVNPMFSMLTGALRYVVENGPINQIAYGIPWERSVNAGSKSGVVFEAIRMSWVALPILCLFFIQKYWRKFRYSRSSLYPAIIFFVFMLMLIPYSMGRIDPAGFSRPGQVSIFAWTMIVPLLVWSIVSGKHRAFVVLTVLFVSSLVKFDDTTLSNLSAVAEQKVHSPQLKDPIENGLTNIGRAHIEEIQWDRINRLSELLELRLAPDETYLDLTSRNAHYFYLNRLPPISVTAPYNLASPNQQRHVVDVLTASPPKLALLQADNQVQDGGGLALRNLFLYRFIVDNYVPRIENGFIVGYLKSDLKSESASVITAEVKNLTNENWFHGVGRLEPAFVLSDPILVALLKVGDRVRLADGTSRYIKKVSEEKSAIWLDGGKISGFDRTIGKFVDLIVSPHVYQEYNASLFHRSLALSEFKKIPVSWGRSQKSLQTKMTSPVSLVGLSPVLFDVSSFDGFYKVHGNDPHIVFDVSTLGISGRELGLLKFDFDCADQLGEPRVQIFWWGDERGGPFEASSVRFTAENGTLIVPLDASPWWLGLKKIKGIRFDLDSASACSAFSVKNISLYQRG